jgi:hypothetical protein
MKQYIALALFGILALPGTAQAQHKFVYRAELTAEGVKDLKARTAVGLRANVITSSRPLSQSAASRNIGTSIPSSASLLVALTVKPRRRRWPSSPL